MWTLQTQVLESLANKITLILLNSPRSLAPLFLSLPNLNVMYSCYLITGLLQHAMGGRIPLLLALILGMGLVFEG